MTPDKTKKLVSVLLKYRPDLVLVKCGTDLERQQLVDIVENNGGKCIYSKRSLGDPKWKTAN